MATFRTGFKIIGEISIKQGFGRIRSFSEDRKPGQWLPEDQWAVRQPGSTCPEPCDKPKKPAKPSKSWLSICKDPDPPIECDIRHNNCPSPPVKVEGPWYSLDNLMPKKKQEKPPPLRSCREELRRRELCGEKEEVCEKIPDKTLTIHIKPEHPETCMPKQEPCPAPVVTLSCPLPKELDIMLWCEQPSKDTSRIPVKCESDKLPYQEFRPQKIWKPSPFSLPIKSDPTPYHPTCNVGSIPYAEFKNVEIPKPLYTRYKSVELSDTNFLLSMTNVKCAEDVALTCVAIKPPSSYLTEQIDIKKEKESCPEKPLIEAASCKPIRLKKAPKYTFRPKPTKLIEKRVFKNPCAQHNISPFRTPDEIKVEVSDSKKPTKDREPPKVITGTLTDEPQVFERNMPIAHHPPLWMYVLCKPGSKETPLVPSCDEFPKEPDWSSETDGLKFYDNNNENITPKPPPEPSAPKKVEIKTEKVVKPPEPDPIKNVPESSSEFKDRFVLMPEKFNIKYSRPEDPCEKRNECESASFEKFIEAKTVGMKKCSKSYPPMKENILYDLQRLCPNLPFDPSKVNPPCRKPPQPECPEPPRFFSRSYSTFSPASLKNLCSVQLNKVQQRTECGDSREKCKVRDLTPKAKECPEPPKPADCAEMTLPCCPKARIPPSCNVRKPMPPCKKKLAPKPSFSECTKDPPPCPKMTECNCWEKKPKKK